MLNEHQGTSVLETDLASPCHNNFKNYTSLAWVLDKTVSYTYDDLDKGHCRVKALKFPGR